MKIVNLKQSNPYIDGYKVNNISFLGNGINMYETNGPNYVYVPIKYQKYIPVEFRETLTWYKGEKQLFPLFFLNRFLEYSKYKDSVSFIDIQKLYPIQSTKYLLSAGYEENKTLKNMYLLYTTFNDRITYEQFIDKVISTNI